MSSTLHNITGPTIFLPPPGSSPSSSLSLLSTLTGETSKSGILKAGVRRNQTLFFYEPRIYYPLM